MGLGSRSDGQSRAIIQFNVGVNSVGAEKRDPCRWAGAGTHACLGRFMVRVS